MLDKTKTEQTERISKETRMPFKLYPQKNNLHKIPWLKFIKISPKNAEIAVPEQLEAKFFFATQQWWVAFKQKCPTEKIFTIFTPGDFSYLFCSY